MKASRIVRVISVDIYAGTYQATSSDGITIYEVNVRTRRCSCPAIQSRCKMGSCAHIVAARVFGKMLATSVRQERARLATMPLLVRVDRVNVAELGKGHNPSNVLPMVRKANAEVLMEASR